MRSMFGEKLERNYLANKFFISWMVQVAVPDFPTAIAAAALATLAANSISAVLAYARDKAEIAVSPAPVTSGVFTKWGFIFFTNIDFHVGNNTM